MLPYILLLPPTLFLAYALHRYIAFRAQLASLHAHPGFRAVFSPMTAFGNLVPYHETWNPGTAWSWRTKMKYYQKHNSSILSYVALNCSQPILSMSNPQAVKIMNTERKKFIKPVESYEILRIYGQNLLVTEGEEWRKHRKIAAPGFSEKTFDLVWRTTVSVVAEMEGAEGWAALPKGGSKVVGDVTKITLKLALAVLAIASFGTTMHWSDSDSGSSPPSASSSAPTPPSPGAPAKDWRMPMGDAISTVSEKIIWILLVPKFMFKLPSKFLKHIQHASESLTSHMHQMIHDRKLELSSPAAPSASPSIPSLDADAEDGPDGKPRRNDLFNKLIESSLEADEDGEEVGKVKGKGLSDDELVGNTFIFALAGHETSAHTLAFTLAYLALDQKVQEWVREEVKEVMPVGEVPPYSTFPLLPRTLAVLYETLRLHPTVVLIPKVNTEDTYLPDEAPDGSGRELPPVFVPKGTQCHIDTVALHRHPTYWTDPDDFKPERFLGDYNRDAFVPFSAGPRACIGRRFAEVEAVCLLALLIRSYSFTVNPLSETETVAEQKTRLLEAKSKLTLTPTGDVGLVVTKL